MLHVTPLATDPEVTARAIAQRTAERAGNPVESVVEEYRTGPYDLPIVGSRGLGTLGQLFLGSVSERLSRLAQGAVVIVK